MNSPRVRAVLILLFFVALVALAVAGILFAFQGVATGERAISENLSWLSFLTSPGNGTEGQADNNFIIPRVAGVTKIANYNYDLFNAPLDYTVRFGGTMQIAVLPRDFDEIKFISVPLLGLSSEVNPLNKRDFGFFEDGSDKDWQTEKEGVLRCESNCAGYSKLLEGDIVKLEAGNDYYFKVVEVARVQNLDELVKKEPLLLAVPKDESFIEKGYLVYSALLVY